jgi:hypothetical protein
MHERSVILGCSTCVASPRPALVQDHGSYGSSWLSPVGQYPPTRDIFSFSNCSSQNSFSFVIDPGENLRLGRRGSLHYPLRNRSFVFYMTGLLIPSAGPHQDDPAIEAHAPGQLHLHSPTPPWTGPESMTTFPFRFTHTVSAARFLSGPVSRKALANLSW